MIGRFVCVLALALVAVMLVGQSDARHGRRAGRARLVSTVATTTVCRSPVVITKDKVRRAAVCVPARRNARHRRG